MKKLIIIAVVIACVPLYLGATLLCAHATHSRIDQSLNRITDQSQGMVKIVARKTENHFFTASEDVTLEIDNPALQLLLKSGAIGNTANRFDIHNVIFYGPVPGGRSIGIARVESSLVLTAEQRKQLIELIGTDKPLRIFTTFGYFGNSYVDVTGPKFNIHPKDGSVTGTWKGLNARFSLSANLRDTSFSGGSPGLIINGKDNSTLRIDDIRFKGALQRKYDVLFDGDESIKIGRIGYEEAGNPSASFAINDVIYAFKSIAGDDFVNFNASMGSGKISYQKTDLDETHLDFGFSHLDTRSTVDLYKVLNETRSDALRTATTGAAAQTPASVEKLKQRTMHDLLTILQHSPLLKFDNLGFVSGDGALKVTGMTTINGVVESDLLPTPQYDALVKKIQLQADINIDQRLIDHWPIAATAASIKQQTAQLEAQGYLTRKGNKLQSHLEFKNGRLTANGKPVGA